MRLCFQSLHSSPMATAGLFDAGFIFLVGALYILVAARVGLLRRRARFGSLALGMFQVWWAGIATLFFTAGASTALRAQGFDAQGVHVALTAIGMVAVSLALWGLVFYVTYVFSGKARWIVPFAVYYAACCAALLYGLARDASEATRWSTSVSALTIQTGPIVTGAIFAFLIPVIGACALYASLYARLENPAQKLRVGLTSLAFLGWFGSAILARLLGVAGEGWWPRVGQSIGVVASMLVVLAYRPPRRFLRGIARGVPGRLRPMS